MVCDGADVGNIVQTACRGVWQNMGQNCAGPERFLVYEAVYDEFVDKVNKTRDLLLVENWINSFFREKRTTKQIAGLFSTEKTHCSSNEYA